MRQTSSQRSRFVRAFGALSALRFGYARERQRKLHVLKHRLMRDQIIALKDKAYGMVSVRIPISVLIFFCGNSIYHKVTVRILIQTADDVQHSLFPHPEGPKMDTNSLSWN